MNDSVRASAVPALAVLAALAVPRPAAAVSLALADRGLNGSADSVLGTARLPVPEPAARVPAAAYALDARALRATGAATLADALRGVPGVVLYDQIGDGYQPTLDLRGFNGNPVPATLVLVDGVRVNEPGFGQVDWQLLPLSDVARVEVLPGPQTAYGPDAMAGVVLVTTKRGGRTPRAEAAATMGSFGLRREEASAEGPAGPLTWRAAASRETADGWRTGSAARLHRASGRVDYRDAATRAWASYRFADDDLRQAGSLTAAELGRDRRQAVSFVENDSLLNAGTLGARRALTDETSLSALASLRRRLENTPLNRGRSSVSSSRAAEESLSGALQLDDVRAAFGRANDARAGVEWSRDGTDSTSAGTYGSSPFANSAFDVRRRLGLFAQESFDLVPRVLVLTLGARWDRASLEHDDRRSPAKSGVREFAHLSPRAGLNWNPSPSLGLYASLSESFRPPTADELSALGPFSSSPELKPVRARGLEAGARARLGAWGEGSVAAYRVVTRDEIYPVYDPVAGYGKNTNIDEVRRDGLEVALSARARAARVFARYTYAEATFRTAFTLDKAPYPATQTVRPGDSLPQVPRHRLFAGASVVPFPGASAGVDELCVSSQVVFGDESNAEPRLGGWCVLGAGASYARGRWRVFARGDNLLSKRYESRGILGKSPSTSALERYLVPAAGVSFSAGVRVSVGG
jgi:outer membrane receptor protein involved in Fe transport